MEKAKTCSGCKFGSFGCNAYETTGARGSCTIALGPPPPWPDWVPAVGQWWRSGNTFAAAVSILHSKQRLPERKELVSREKKYASHSPEEKKIIDEWYESICIWGSFWIEAQVSGILIACHKLGVCDDWESKAKEGEKLKPAMLRKCLEGKAKPVTPFKLHKD